MFKKLRKIVKVIEFANRKVYGFSEGMIIDNIIGTWKMNKDYDYIISKISSGKAYRRLAMVRSTAVFYEEIGLIKAEDLKLVKQYFNNKFNRNKEK